MPEPPADLTPEEKAKLAELAERVTPPEAPMAMQPGEAELTPPLPSHDTKQAGLAAAAQQGVKGGARQAPDQVISEETRQRFDRVFGNNPSRATSDDTPSTPSNSSDLTPGR